MTDKNRGRVKEKRNDAKSSYLNLPFSFKTALLAETKTTTVEQLDKHVKMIDKHNG